MFIGLRGDLMIETSVELRNLTKSYNGENFAVKEANVTIQPGEFFILVGPSGCGKSTLLRMIAGLEEITAGEVWIGGQFANTTPPNKRNISMVFQNYALYPHLTVEENIIFGLKVRKVSKNEQKKRCMEAATMLGMTDYLKRKPRELSGGQRQRVALARAVVSEMPICLMDEPLSNLDAKLRGQMRTEIRQLQQKLGITMIYVTHDQVEAMTMGDRIMVLKDGEVQQVGDPLEIYNHPTNEFVANFIGSPPMNISPAKNKGKFSVLSIEDSFVLPLNNKSQAILNDRSVNIGIRPEHLVPESSIDDSVDRITFKTEVKNVEILGNETLVAFEIGENIWKAKIPGQWRYKQGEKLLLSVSHKHIHFFDRLTGQAINLRLSPKSFDRQVEQEVHLF